MKGTSKAKPLNVF